MTWWPRIMSFINKSKKQKSKIKNKIGQINRGQHINKAYRPNAHLLHIVMHYNGNIISFYIIIITTWTNFNHTNPSLGGTTIWTNFNYTYPRTMCVQYHSTTNVKNMHLHRDSNPGPWNTVPMLWPLSYEDAQWRNMLLTSKHQRVIVGDRRVSTKTRRPWH